MEEFTTFDIVKILGIPRERLKDWMSGGFIEPSISKAEGKGTKNLFDKDDLIQIALFQHLISQGIVRSKASLNAFTWRASTKTGYLGKKSESYTNILVLMDCLPGTGELFNLSGDYVDEERGCFTKAMQLGGKKVFTGAMPFLSFSPGDIEVPIEGLEAVKKTSDPEFFLFTMVFDPEVLSTATSLYAPGLPGSPDGVFFFGQIASMVREMIPFLNRMSGAEIHVEENWTDIKIINMERIIKSVDGAIKDHKD